MASCRKFPAKFIEVNENNSPILPAIGPFMELSVKLRDSARRGKKEEKYSKFVRSGVPGRLGREHLL